MITFSLGDEVFVREPQRYVKECTCIVGPVSGSQPLGSAMKYQIDAEICFKGRRPNVKKQIWIHAIDLGHQIGTPLSQVTGEMLDRMGREWRGENEL